MYGRGRALVHEPLSLSQVRISVVIPVFRSATYIRDCLQSVLDQQFGVEEIVLVDDCTDDDSIEIATRFLAASTVEVSVIRQDRNQGAGRARNAGVTAATGNVIWFFDSDDLAAPAFTAEMAGALVAHDADFVTCRTSFVEENGTMIGTVEPRFRETAVSGRDFASMLINGDVKAYPTPRLFRRDVLGDHPWDDRRAYEDMAATTRIALRSSTVALIDEPLMSYRQHDQSTSHVVAPHTRDVFAMGEEMSELIGEMFDGKQARRLARRFLYRETLIPAAHLAMRARHDRTGEPALIGEILEKSRRRSRVADTLPLLCDRQFRSAAFALTIKVMPNTYSAVLRRR